jgi:putative aminopeptidase FrvX
LITGIGGFMIAEVARMIYKNKVKLPYSLYVVNAVQEEIGLRGAEMIARRIKPDIAIITDVTHDTTTPMVNKIIEGDIAVWKGALLLHMARLSIINCFTWYRKYL